MASRDSAPDWGWVRGGGRSLVVGLPLAIALLVWVFRRVDLESVTGELRRADGRWLLLAVLAQTGSLAVRGWRWHSVIRRRAAVPLRAAVGATYAGWVALALLPARLGELARPWLLARRHPIDRSFAFGAQLLERLLDVVCLLALLSIYLGFGAPHARTDAGLHLLSELGRTSRLLLGLVIGLLLLLVGAVFAAPRIGRALDRNGRWAPRGWQDRIVDRVSALAAGVTGVRSSRALAIATSQSMLLWLLVAAGHWFLFLALGLELPLVAVAPLLFFAVLGALVPTPAAIGSYHAAVQLALASLLGVPVHLATAYALVSHAVAYVPNLSIGSLFLLLGEGSPTRRNGSLPAGDAAGD